MEQKIFIERPSENFTQIPNELLQDKRFNKFKKYGLYAKLLVMNLYQHDARSWSPTRKGEADNLGISTSIFNNRVLPIAKQLGWLEISNEGSRGRNGTWIITIPDICQPVSTGDTPGVSTGDTLYNTITYNTNTSEFSEDEKINLINSILNSEPTRAITIARKALRDEKLELSQIKNALKKHVTPRHAHLANTPMFAIRLEEYKSEADKTKEHIKLSNLWVSLREDVTGVPSVSDGNEFRKIVGIIKNLLKKYSYSQVYWTVTKVVSSSVEDMKFMVNGPNTIEFFVKKYAKDFRAIKESDLRSEEAHDRILAQRELEDKEYEKQRNRNQTEVDENAGRLLKLLNWKRNG
jgi:hypothetical protein